MKREEFNIEEDAVQNQHRRAFRVEPPATVSLRIAKEPKQYQVKDISFLGVAFIDENYADFRIGQKFKIDVLLKEYVFLQSLSAEVVRIISQDMCVACSFPELTSTDEIRLTKLVLEIQKEYIRKKRYT